MKRLLLGLMLLVTAGAAIAEWTSVGESVSSIHYVDRATIRRNGNLVKMWDLMDFKTVQTVQTVTGESFLSIKSQNEYDCKEERKRILAFTWFSGQMGSEKFVYSNSDPGRWEPIQPGSIGEIQWNIACGKK